ncbi:hypothetical protein KBC99_03030 [Candidatus Saccharibacteria bacterium]|nr:hypothetical protein [Candidatus Saccharibacteria bacterium]
MTPTELYTHISEADGIPMQELNPLQHELMQIAEEAMALKSQKASMQVSDEYLRAEQEFNRVHKEKLADQKIEQLYRQSDDLVDQAIATAYGAKGLKSEAICYIAKNIARSGDTQKALTLLDSAPSHELDLYDKSNTLFVIASLRNDPDLYEEAIQDANAIMDRYEKGSVFAANIARSLDGRVMERALKIVELIDEQRDRDSLLLHIIEGLAEVGDIEQALDIRRSIVGDEIASEAEAKIVTSLVEQDDIERATTISNNIEIPYFRAKALVAIAEKTNSPETFTLLGIVAARITDPYEKADTFLDWYSITHDQEKKELVLQFAQHIVHHHYRDEVLGSLANAVAQTDDFDGALGIALMIAMENPSNKAYADIAAEIGRYGDFDRALTLVNKIKDPYFVIEALNSLAIETRDDVLFKSLIDQALKTIQASGIEGMSKVQLLIKIADTLKMTAQSRS